MRRNKFSVNFIFNLIFQLVTIIYPLIVTPYIARIFKSNGVGRYSFSVSIVTYFTLIFLCIGKYGFREVSFVESDKTKESNVFFEILIIKVIILVFLSLIYIVVSFLIPNYTKLILVQWVALLNGVFDISWYIQGKQNFKITALIGVFNKVMLIVLIFLLVKSSDDINKYAFLISGVTFIGSISMWPFLKGNICKPGRICLKKHLKNCFLVSLPFLIIEVYSSIDKTMLGVLTKNEYENGYYEETIKIIKILMTIVTAMSIVKAPSHSKMIQNNEEYNLIKSLMNSFKYCFFVSIPLMFGICLVANDFIPLFLGDGYEKVVILIYVYSPFTILYGIVDLLAIQYFVPTRKQNIYTFSVFISLIVNVVLNIVLVIYYGSLGAILATVISELVCCSILFFSFRSVIGFGSIILNVWRFIVAGIIMFILVFFVNKCIDNLYLRLILDVVIGGIIYFSSLLILKETYLYDIICLLYKKVFKKRFVNE